MRRGKSPGNTIDARALVGTFRTFGKDGPAYEVLGFTEKAGEPVFRIRVVQTGEEAEHTLTELLEDPEAR